VAHLDSIIRIIHRVDQSTADIRPDGIIGDGREDTGEQLDHSFPNPYTRVLPISMSLAFNEDSHQLDQLYDGNTP